jgi:hypothetical protein
MKIRGVVDDRDEGIARLTTDGAWALRLVLSPWRDAEGRLIDGRVVVARCCRSNAELEAARAEQPKLGDLVEVEVDAAESVELRTGGPRELAYVGCSVIEDDELERFASALAPPAEVTDVVLGTFAFDPSMCWYTAHHRSASGASYEVRLTPPDPKQPGPRIEQARAIVAWVDANLDAIGRAVADELWPLWDRTWRQDDEDDIDREAFERRLSLYSVSWDEEQSEGDFSLSFDDGGLFGDHGIAAAVEGFVVRSAELYG